MAKLTKAQTKAHNIALEILQKDVLTFNEKWEVLENYHEGARHMQGMAGAFFTPVGLARDFAIDACGGRRVLDLCAGIGALAFQTYHRQTSNRPDEREPLDYVCIEQCAEYVEIGRKILPEATWIQADVKELPNLGLGMFDGVISNPPFGSVSRDWKGPRYTGRDFEFHLMDLASDHARYGAFIIPQQSSGFRFSGQRGYDRSESTKYQAFEKQTGIYLEPGCGIDTAFYKDDWHGVSPTVEVVCVDFEEMREARAARAADAHTATAPNPHAEQPQAQLALAI